MNTLVTKLNGFIEKNRRRFLSKTKAYEYIRDCIVEGRENLPTQLYNLAAMLYIDDYKFYEEVSSEINLLGRRDAKRI